MLHLTLLLAISSPHAGVELATLRRGDVTARAEVRIAEQGLGPGRGRATFTVTVEGPATLEVEGPRLEDALAAWRVGWQASSWSGAETVTWECTLGLVQLKPGAAPLPGIRLRVRARPSDPWQDVSWLDPLHEARDVAPIVDLPALPSPAWRGPLILTATIAIPILLLGLLLLWVWRRETHSPPQPAWRRALALLGEDASVEQVTAVVRVFLQEQGALPASRLTTAELLAILHSRGDLATDVLAKLRQLLELGDLVKFAGYTPTADDAGAAQRSGRELVEALATWPSGEKGTTGEVG